WKKLLEQADAGKNLSGGAKIPDKQNDPLPEPSPLSPDNADKTAQTAREQIQTGSWYILLDFAELLEKQTPRVWRLLKNQDPPAGEPPFTSAENELAEAITKTTFTLPDDTAKARFVFDTAYKPEQILSSLKDALLAVKSGSIKDHLEAVKTSFNRKLKPQ